jgi:hypothetical protein
VNREGGSGRQPSGATCGIAVEGDPAASPGVGDAEGVKRPLLSCRAVEENRGSTGSAKAEGVGQRSLPCRTGEESRGGGVQARGPHGGRKQDSLY